MCLNPITLPSRNKYVDVSNIGLSIVNTVNCGKCAECLQMKQSEYCLRAEAEYTTTIKQDGFCLWETFTYSNDNVPYYTFFGDLGKGLSEAECNELKFRGKLDDKILCFNPKDYVDFMKRLRKQLLYYGFDPKDGLKYFWVSEYGGITHRPHYHAIFFVTIPDLTPELFEYYLKKSWKQGRLDETKSVHEKVLDGVGAINYVSKYTTKDDEFTSVLKGFFGESQILSMDTKLKNSLFPFHRQSQGFGLGIINQQNYQFMYETGKMQISDKLGYHEVGIPMYIKRKLWYKQVKFEDGSLHWILNEEGKKQAKEYGIPNQIEKMADNYKQLVDNANVTFPSDYLSFNIQDKIRELLGDRSYRDLAVYARLVDGRNYTQGYSEKELIDFAVEKDNEDYTFIPELLKKGYDLHHFLNLETIYSKEKGGYRNLNGYFVSTSSFMNQYSTNFDLFPQYKSFDAIIDLIRLITMIISREKQGRYDHRQAIKNRLKKLSHKGYNF